MSNTFWEVVKHLKDTRLHFIVLPNGYQFSFIDFVNTLIKCSINVMLCVAALDFSMGLF